MAALDTILINTKVSGFKMEGFNRFRRPAPEEIFLDDLNHSRRSKPFQFAQLDMLNLAHSTEPSAQQGLLPSVDVTVDVCTAEAAPTPHRVDPPGDPAMAAEQRKESCGDAGGAGGMQDHGEAAWCNAVVFWHDLDLDPEAQWQVSNAPLSSAAPASDPTSSSSASVADRPPRTARRQVLQFFKDPFRVDQRPQVVVHAAFSDDAKEVAFTVLSSVESQASQESLSRAVVGEPITTNGTARDVAAVSRWHFGMLNDTVRNAAYDEAIARAVAAQKDDPDSIVLDIGSGSGLLAMMAARGGAKRIVSCEACKPLSIAAKEIITENGFDGSVFIFPAHSTKLKPRMMAAICDQLDDEREEEEEEEEEMVVGGEVADAEKAQGVEKETAGLDGGEGKGEEGEAGSADDDTWGLATLLISEIVDVGLLGEHIMSTVLHARRDLCRADATVIPCSAVVYASLVYVPSQAFPLSYTLRKGDGAGRGNRGSEGEGSKAEEDGEDQGEGGEEGVDMTPLNAIRGPSYEQVRLADIDHSVLSAPFEVFAFDLEHPACLVPTQTARDGGAGGAGGDGGDGGDGDAGGVLGEAASTTTGGAVSEPLYESIPYNDDWSGVEYTRPVTVDGAAGKGADGADSENMEVNAVAFWFNLRLDAQTVLDTGPESGRNSWNQAVQFLPSGVHRVKEGERMQITAKVDGQDGTRISFVVAGAAVEGVVEGVESRS